MRRGISTTCYSRIIGGVFSDDNDDNGVDVGHLYVIFAVIGTYINTDLKLLDIGELMKIPILKIIKKNMQH